MILVDSSLWVEHLRRGHPRLQGVLETEPVVTHDFVLGELSLGHLKKGSDFLKTLAGLPRLLPADHEEVLAAVDRLDLRGSGIGWIDAHLVASCLIEGARLWTIDRVLLRALDGAQLLFEAS
ncbi:MAG: type II toxin-antitoxin system VapC family toxin [Phycisphaerales bacterium]